MLPFLSPMALALSHNQPAYSYRQLMQLVLKYTGRKRPILSFPFVVGTVQGAILEKLPVNLFTITRAQVSERFSLIPFY